MPAEGSAKYRQEIQQVSHEFHKSFYNISCIQKTGSPICAAMTVPFTLIPLLAIPGLISALHVILDTSDTSARVMLLLAGSSPFQTVGKGAFHCHRSAAKQLAMTIYLNCGIYKQHNQVLLGFFRSECQNTL